jgi:protein O-mannosyl-transferase
MTTSLPTAPTGRSPQTRKVVGICVFLILAILAVFGQTARFEFVNYDDNQYIYENPEVQKGLTWGGVRWALRYTEIGHWHPLTWLTHMADCQAYGLWAGGHHITNVVLHAIATVFLFLILRRMTGSLWRSAFVAAVFAVHPLRAESVAWIAERKDVLSGVLFMLTLWAYVNYAARPSIGRYVAVAVLFVLGLLSKNMLVTLPFVLLLLDWWPLGRMRQADGKDGKGRPQVVGIPFWGLLREKIPLLLLSAASCIATEMVSEKLPEADHLPALPRLGNAAVTYVVYMRQMVFPTGLANLYPNPRDGLPIWKVSAGLALLTAVTAFVVAGRHKRPFLLVGWLWYLGMLVPVIGLVQMSYCSHADRYTYLPEIGLALVGTWAVGELSAGWKHRNVILGSLMAVVLVALAICGHVQTSYWKDSELLWRHTLSCTSDNFIAHLDLADFLRLRGKLDEAGAEYRQALALRPNDVEALNDLGNLKAMTGHDASALELYQKAMTLRPGYVQTYGNLGNLLMHTNIEDAIAQYRKGLAISPDSLKLLNDLGKALAIKGDDAGAIEQYLKVLAIEPGYANTHFNLGNRYLKLEKYEEAAAQYRKASELQPDDLEARTKLGQTLLMQGDFAGAMASFREAIKIDPQSAQAWANLGLACLKKGAYKEAVDAWQQSLAVAPDQLYVQNSLARLLATAPEASLRDGPKAVALATQANQSSGGGNPVILETLAAAYAQTGSFKQAADTARHALELAAAKNDSALVAILKKEMSGYETNTPPPNEPR